MTGSRTLIQHSPSPRTAPRKYVPTLVAGVLLVWVALAAPGAAAQQPGDQQPDRPTDQQPQLGQPEEPAPAGADQLEVEDQIPIDSANAIHEITPDLRNELGLFPDVEGFTGARLFRLEDGRTVLEISFREEDGRQMRERRYLPPDVLESLRTHLQERIAERGLPVPRERDPGAADPPPELGAPDSAVVAGAPDSAAEAEPRAGDTATARRTAERPPESDREAEPDPADAPAPSGEVDPAAETEETRGGRARLLFSQAALGFGYYGWAMPQILGLDDDGAILATHALTAGASVLVPYLLTRSRAVRSEEARMAWWGGTRGVVYGILGARAALGADDGSAGYNRIQLGAGLGASVLGTLLGYKITEWADLDDGRGAVWRTMADIGAITGLGTAYATGLYDNEEIRREIEGDGTDDSPWYEWDGPGDRAEGATVLESRPENPHYQNLPVFGMALSGLAAGRWLGRHYEYTEGGAYALRSVAALGAQIGLPLSELTLEDGDSRPKRYALGAAAGGILGAAAGAWLLADRDVTPRQGLMLNAGQLAGGVLALGGTWLLTRDSEDDELLYGAAAAIGSAAGLGLTYRYVVNDRGRLGVRRDGGDSRASSSERARTDGMQLSFSPAALVASMAAGAGSASDRRPVTPSILTIRF